MRSEPGIGEGPVRGAPFALLLLRHAGRDRPLLAHAARVGSFAPRLRSAVTSLINSHCTSAGALAARLGLADGVTRGLTYVFERWDGSGLPAGAERRGRN